MTTTTMMIKNEAALSNEAAAATETATNTSTSNEIRPSAGNDTLLSTSANDTVDKDVETEAKEEEEASLRHDCTNKESTNKVDESPTNKHSVVVEDKEEVQKEVTSVTEEGADNDEEQATTEKQEEDHDDELNYEITIVSKRHLHTSRHEDDAMSVISSLTFAEATPNHGHHQEYTSRTSASTTISVKQQRSKPGTIIKKLLHLGGEQQKNNNQNKRHSDVVGDLERGFSKTTVFTSFDDSSSNDSDTPSPSPLEEEVDTSANEQQQQQQQYVSPTTTYSEMKGFMIAISIACVGVLLLGLACLLWWTSHNNGGQQHYAVSSSVTDRQDHFIPGSRFLEQDAPRARFSLAPEVEVLDYMLKAASKTST